MNGLFRTVLTLSLTACLLGSAFVGDAAAQKEKGKKKAGMAAGQQIFTLPKEITLTDEQKTKLEEIKKEHGPKLAELTKKIDDTLTDDQKKARKEAGDKARADGKKGKDLQAAVDAAVALTDDQKKSQETVKPELTKLQGAIREKIHGLLTTDQQTHYKLPGKKKNK
jgi:hypothetical protein